VILKGKKGQRPRGRGDKNLGWGKGQRPRERGTETQREGEKLKEIGTETQTESQGMGQRWHQDPGIQTCRIEIHIPKYL
jgi:hypothetical protein